MYIYCHPYIDTCPTYSSFSRKLTSERRQVPAAIEEARNRLLAKLEAEWRHGRPPGWRLQIAERHTRRAFSGPECRPEALAQLITQERSEAEPPPPSPFPYDRQWRRMATLPDRLIHPDDDDDDVDEEDKGVVVGGGGGGGGTLEAKHHRQQQPPREPGQ
eukprot:Protomagalhaensia_sp_Gyna_25__630@NODE_1297_length_1965_cov_52_862928_g1036_i0_p2_GENE_NODE_1297_length_1965_cov_52_862928_g1036_i0NODE_1297_length_1965_cov_52_862928_g1036_i0_p2_ORF_typecomplete_len160_score32_02_NODE_1297_length_1965_cov_52_862928_g1036_i0344823